MFPLRALAALAGRLPLGGEREVAMALLLSARLALGCSPRASLDPTLRRARGAGARQWCSAMSLPPAVRSAVLQVAESTAQESPDGVAAALERVLAHASGVLDAPSRTEMRQLLAALRAS